MTQFRMMIGVTQFYVFGCPREHKLLSQLSCKFSVILSGIWYTDEPSTHFILSDQHKRERTQLL